MMRYALVLLLLAGVLLPSPLPAQSPPAQSPSEGEEGNLPYEVEIQGVEDEALAREIDAASRLVGLKDHPPPGAIALQHRANEDRERLADALRARGYYDGAVDIAVDTASHPAKVTVTIRQGPPTLLTSWRTDPDQGITPRDVGLTLGRPALAGEVIAAESKLLTLLAQRRHPLAKMLRRRAVVDHAAHGMTVSEELDPGPEARFAAPQITGLTDLDPRIVRNRVPWREGDPYDPAKLERLRKILSDSSLFRTIRITTGDQLDEDGLLPVTIDLVQRSAHSVGVGALYSTSEGPAVQAYWEDRNLFGEAEKLRLTALASSPRELALADYRAPDYFGRDRDLVGDLSFEQLASPAFFSRDALASAGVDWHVNPLWTLGGAVALEHEMVHQSGEAVHHYDLLSWPLSARRDTTDNPLDPVRGGRSILTVRPFVSVTGDSRPFTRLEASQTLHAEVAGDPRIVLAGWGNAGAFLNGGQADIPADKLFYAGGGGSVRAYRLRYAGPLDNQGRPTGGRSLLAGGGEIRIKVTEDIGIVPFVDGANVFSTGWPKVTGRWFWGPGLGLRYFTPIGPIRFDIATPLYRRPGTDDAYQIYVSVGQAF